MIFKKIGMKYLNPHGIKGKVRDFAATAGRELVGCAEQTPKTALPPAPPDLFDELILRRIDGFDKRDKVAFRYVQDLGFKGLLATRASNYDVAQEHFDRANRLLRKLISLEARMLAHSILDAEFAYFCYRQEQFHRSISFLEQSFGNDLQLEQQYGYHELQLHRIQLLNNLMRIHRRQDCFSEALKLGNSLLTYLEMPETSELSHLPHPWEQGWSDGLSGVPDELVTRMHAQIARDQLLALEKALSVGLAKLALIDALQSITLRASSSQAGLWLQFQLARLDPAFGDHRVMAYALLRRGASPSEPLWRSVAGYARSDSSSQHCDPPPPHSHSAIEL